MNNEEKIKALTKIIALMKEAENLTCGEVDKADEEEYNEIINAINMIAKGVL